MSEQIRILDYLHVSTQDMKKDSNFLTHCFIYKYLFKYYPTKFHFYLTYPYSEKNKEVFESYLGKYKHITKVPIKYFSTNAFFRNALDWESLSKNAADYDIVWNNTPEIAYELLSFSISKGIYCGIMNYAHWYPRIINKPIFANYLKGQHEKYCIDMKYFHNFLLSQNNYMNSEYGRKHILEGFTNIIGNDIIKKIEHSFKPLYLTVDHEDIDKYKNEKIEVPDCPVLIFNHRHQVYTGFTDFCLTIKKVIDMKPELKFKIFFSDSGNMDLKDKFNIPEEYILDLSNKSYKDYITILWNLKGIQLGTHTGTNQWSMSFIDGMFSNNIPFYRKNIFFDEMFKGMNNLSPYQFSNENTFIENIIYLIKNYKEYEQDSSRFFKHFRDNWTWDTLIHPWSKAFQQVYNENRFYKNSEKIKNFPINKLPMNWNQIKDELVISDQRPTNQYRATLKRVHNLKEDINNDKIVIYRKDQKIRTTEGFF